MLAKICPKCKIEKSYNDYHKDKGSNTGLAYWCKLCAGSNARKNHARRMQIDPAYALSKKNDYLKDRYGLSVEEYKQKLITQQFCAICHLDLLSIKDKPHLDHCHKTGKVREFLCKHCNCGLGDFKDSESSLETALEYLRKHK
jgi:hypothetical protein